jgi:hypothetical protein
VSLQWPKKWKYSSDIKDLLCRYLGEGLRLFSSHGVENKRVLTKTPNVKGLRHFRKFFPEARVIVLVRDGRSVVESGMRIFNWKFESAVQRWKDSADEIIEYEKNQYACDSGYLRVRYEDLILNEKEELEKIFNFLDLSTNDFDFEKIKNLPVIHSSFHDGSVKPKDFDPTERQSVKPKDFDSIKRHKKWSRIKHERFNWLANDELLYFGYSPEEQITYKFFWKLFNLLLDQIYVLKKLNENVLFAAKKAFHRVFSLIKKRKGKK